MLLIFEPKPDNSSSLFLIPLLFFKKQLLTVCAQPACVL
jgi:hypothetical protein